MTEYFLSETPYGTCVVRLRDGVISFIPEDGANPDFVAYQEWLAEGNTPEPWHPAES